MNAKIKGLILGGSLIVLGLVIAFNPAFGQFYQYTDKNGNTVFTDKPPVGSGAREKRLKEDGIYRSNRGDADYPAFENKDSSHTPPRAKEERKRDYSRVTVIMYMTDWCGYCKKARQYISSLGAELIEYNIDKDKSKKDEMRQKSGGGTGVPLIDINGTIIHGYNTEAIKAALDRSAD